MNFLFYLYSLLIPFQEYFFNIADNLRINFALIIPYLTFLNIKNFKFDKNKLFLFFLFSISFLFPNFEISKQLLLFLFLGFPVFLIRLKNKHLNFLLKGLRDISYFLILMIYLEIAIQILFGSKGLYLLKSIYWIDMPALLGHIQFDSKYFGLVRPNTLFYEPSHVALCLSFLFVVVDKSWLNNKNLIKTLMLTAILLTGSLSAIITTLVYWVSDVFISIFKRVVNEIKNSSFSLNSVKLIFYFFLGIAVNIFILLLTNYERIKKAISFFNIEGNIDGSEAERINAILVIFKIKYPHNIFGYGLGQIKEFTQSLTYSETFMSSKIPNILTNLIISIGLLGTFFFLVSIFGILIYSSGQINFSIIIYLLFLSLSLGSFYNSYLWQPFFVLINVLEMKKIKESFN